MRNWSLVKLISLTKKKKKGRMSLLRSRGDKGSCMPLFTLEKFKKRLSEMLPEAGGG